jgi:hypothetical protein
MADISKRIKFPPRQRGDVERKTAAYTLKDSDSGKTFTWNSATSFNFTLPPVAKASKGVFFHFVVQTAATGGTGHGVSPAAVDYVAGATATAVDDKDVYFATASDAIGNGFTLISDGVDGWQAINISGTLAQEA